MIDAHQHFWNYDSREYAWIDDSMSALRRDFVPADARREMDAVGVSSSIAVQARQTLDETARLLSLADAHPFIAGVVGWVDLQAADVGDQLARLASNPRLVGIRHIVQSEPDDRFLLRPAFCRGIAQLQAFGLVYDILIYPRQLRVACEFVSRFEGQRFVLDHVAKPSIRDGEITAWARDLRKLATFPNVYCKLSGLVTEAHWTRWTPEQIRPYLDVAFEAFGADRLMIGSDWPVCTLAADYRRTLEIVIDYLARHPAIERDGVLSGNAERCWNLGARRGPRGEVRECQ